MATVKYDPGRIETKVEASQKGWLLVRALAKTQDAITHIVADHPHDWKAYYEAKERTIRAFEQFERWYGR